jgi:hypothetical protein
MRNSIAVLFSLIIAAIAPAGYANPPYEPGLVFIGVAGRHLNRNRAIETALEDAARKAAFYHSVEGEVVDREVSGLGFSSDSFLRYDTGYKKYINDLQFNPDTGVSEEGDVCMVRAIYANAPPLNIDYIKPPANVRPLWIDNPPREIGGYPAAVAMADRQSTAAKTIITSYENAVYNLLQNHLVSLKTRHIADDETFISVSSAVSSGTVYGFYVVDFWTDPQTKAVWTIAVARSVIPNDFSGENQ